LFSPRWVIVLIVSKLPYRFVKCGAQAPG